MTIELCKAEVALAREFEHLGAVARDVSKRVLWFWQSEQCLVAPRNLATLPGFGSASEELANQGWPVFVRGTGGDVTPQGAGIVNVTHVYARSPGGPVDLETEYNRICAPICAALGEGATVGWQPGAFCDGAYNVQLDGRKFAGTAMRFRPCKEDKICYAILSHALMLFAPPPKDAIDALNLFLARLEQPRQIDLSAHTGLPSHLDAAAFIDRLAHAFMAQPV